MKKIYLTTVFVIILASLLVLTSCVGPNSRNNNGNNINYNDYVDDSENSNDNQGEYHDSGSGQDDDGENEGEHGGQGEEEQPQQPESLRITVFDLDKENKETLYISENVKNGVNYRFDWCGFVLYSDKECKNELDPNTTYTITSDMNVYRKDHLNREPIFLTVHYYINGIEDTSISGHQTFFKGEILPSGRKIHYDTNYVYYRDANKTQKMFENGVEVIRPEDDKINIYAYKEDPLMHKVTFKIGDNELGTTLMYDGVIIGEYSAMMLSGTTQYLIRDCTGFNTPVTTDMVVVISEYEVLRYFPITVYCCYDGDVKYSFVNYALVGEEGEEISKEMGYYTDATCTTQFIGTINNASVFYVSIPVNFDRYVGN